MCQGICATIFKIRLSSPRKALVCKGFSRCVSAHGGTLGGVCHFRVGVEVVSGWLTHWHTLFKYIIIDR